MKERILLVDDERDFVDCLAKRLQLRGIDCETAYNGAEAIQKISSGGFAAIVLDMLMPDMNGTEVLRLARIISPQSLVIILTGHASSGEGMKSLQEGAVQYLIKPVELETLLDELNTLLAINNINNTQVMLSNYSTKI